MHFAWFQPQLRLPLFNPSGGWRKLQHTADVKHYRANGHQCRPFAFTADLKTNTFQISVLGPMTKDQRRRTKRIGMSFVVGPSSFV
jgi:hypothetical protein